MSIAVVAEKPSVARDLARALSAHQRGEGYLHGNGYVVTWAIGHLVGLAQPHQMNPQWKAWRRETLPMLPGQWPLEVLDGTRAQFDVVRRILVSPKVEKVICATDAGREGELIFRFVYEATGCTKRVERLWISSLTDEAIRDGFKRLRPSSELDGLAAAGRGRSQADWLVGMNLSRAYGLACDVPLSVGRVQTPTLAMLVEREQAIRRFVPEDYLEVVATFSPASGERSPAPGERYQGTWFIVRGNERVRRLPPDGVQAKEIVERAKRGKARIVSLRRERKRLAPPQLYDLTELQRQANRLYGLSAQRTLEVAQALYERHKLLSYPRTDSRFLTRDVARTLPSIVSAIRGPFEALLSPETGQAPLSSRFVDDAKVGDHHALIPTGNRAETASLSQDERRIYELVCRRLLAAWQPDYVWDATSVVTEVRVDPAAPSEVSARRPGPASEEAHGHIDRYASSGTAVIEPGWKRLEPSPSGAAPSRAGATPKDGKASQREEPTLPAGLHEGQAQRVLDARAVEKKTTPPPRFTEASLLTAMESAGKTLDEKELSEAMRECGLGTPATRASIIETLLARGYLERQGKSLVPTDKGMALIAVVDPEVKSPAMTGDWEARLNRLTRGEGSLGEFMAGIESYVRRVVEKVPPRIQVPEGPRTSGREQHRPTRRRNRRGQGGGTGGRKTRRSSRRVSRPDRSC